MFKAILKGFIGEKVTQFGMWANLDDSIYRRFHDVIVPSLNGTTQIDHVVISRYGIFVIETKNYDGWIYGNETQRLWTQVIYRNKNQFQNPLHQNYKHTKSLATLFNLPHNRIHSVVYFAGKAEFKTQMPPNVINSSLSSYIKKFKQVIFDDKHLAIFESLLIDQKQGQLFKKIDHFIHVKTNNQNSLQCPKCNAVLVERTAKNGKYAGKKFFGCSNYPRCRYTKTN